MDRRDVAAAACPNPWCTCEPCRCEPPCSCGLTVASHGQETSWDANTSTLHHVVTTTYRPTEATPRPAHGHAQAAVPPLPTAATDDVESALVGLDVAAASAQVAAYVARGGHEHHDEHSSIRRARHLGHDIEVHTTYRVMVDGRELVGHFGVDDDGVTHYHGLPNYQEASALDLVKRVVEQFPDDFPPAEDGDR